MLSEWISETFISFFYWYFVDILIFSEFGVSEWNCVWNGELVWLPFIWDVEAIDDSPNCINGLYEDGCVYIFSVDFLFCPKFGYCWYDEIRSYETFWLTSVILGILINDDYYVFDEIGDILLCKLFLFVCFFNDPLLYIKKLKRDNWLTGSVYNWPIFYLCSFSYF